MHYSQNKTAKIDGRGVQKSYVLNDSAVFRLPVFYNQQLPEQSVRDDNDAKNTDNIKLRCFRTEHIWAFDNPEPNPLDSIYSLQQKL